MVKLFLAIPFIIDRIQSFFYRKSFKICGSNVYLRPSSSDFKGLENMSIGNNVSIPKGAVIYLHKSKSDYKRQCNFWPTPYNYHR